MLESGFVRIYRSFLNWEWYDDANTMRVFLHLILTANWEPKKWHGKEIQRGQRVTSYASLSSELKISVKSVRTAINHLKRTGEVAILTTHEYSIITIKNYEMYQDVANQTANEGQTSGKAGANEGQQLKKDKESNKDKKGNRENIKEIFSDYAGNDKELLNALNDFAEMRKAIKKPLSTERVAKMLLTSLDKLTTDGKEKIAILNQSIFKNWQGVFPLKGDDCNAGQVANNGGNNGARSGRSAEKIPQYGKVY